MSAHNNSSPPVDPSWVPIPRGKKSPTATGGSFQDERAPQRSLSASRTRLRTPTNADATNLGKGRGTSETEVLREMLERKNEIIKEQDQKISKLVQDLISTQLEFRKTAYLDDSDLRASWRLLEQNVSQLIIRNCESRLDNNEAALRSLAGDLCREKILDKVQPKPIHFGRLLLEAHVWNVLLENVFGASGHIWAGKAHEPLAALKFEFEGM